MIHRGYGFDRLRPKRLAALAALMAAPFLITGCGQSGAMGLLETGTASAPSPFEQASAAGGTEETEGKNTQVRTARTGTSREQSANPMDALVQARRLRLSNDKTAALNMLEKEAQRFPQHGPIATERALLTLELGRVARAEKLLVAAIKHTPDDWRLHSALGAALATQARHKEAIQQLQKALRLSPDNPAILNNLALSHTMSGNLAKAEQMLRRVVSKSAAGSQASRANQNLALVLGLRGKLSESQRIAASALPRETAESNIALLRRLSSRDRVSRAEPSSADPRSGRYASLPQNP